MNIHNFLSLFFYLKSYFLFEEISEYNLLNLLNIKCNIIKFEFK